MSRILACILALTTALSAEVTLVPDRLVVDGLVWCDAVFARGGAKGWFKHSVDFRHRLATLGLTGKISPAIASRFEFDFSRQGLRDLYVEFDWQQTFGLRGGQMLLPLSGNGEIPEAELNLEEYSLLYYTNILKPENPRDIGLLCWYQSDTAAALAIRAITGVVNGTGPNTGDNNNAKDLFLRIILQPGHSSGATVGTRIYYGWVRAEAVPWLGMGVEGRFQTGPLLVAPELALRRHQNRNTLAANLKVETRIDPLTPALSLELIRWEDGKVQWRALPGLSIRAHERVKILIGFQYHSLVDNWEYQSLLVRLQAAL